MIVPGTLVFYHDPSDEGNLICERVFVGEKHGERARMYALEAEELDRENDFPTVSYSFKGIEVDLK